MRELRLSTVGAVCALVAVILFLLAAFDVSLGSLDLVTLGFAAFAGSFLLDTWKR